ncbi:MAG: Hsp70 family protein [Planctomycetaceae bacterium]
MAENTIAPAVGIDLGTTFSVVAHLDNQGRPWTIANSEGDLTTPSIVFFDDGQAIVGKEAVKAAEFDPERVARFAKREMGNRFLDREIIGRQFPPEIIQSLILKKLRDDAALKLGDFHKVVVTVPAYFNEPRRRRTQDAGRMAGLDVLDIINEPTAAAIAYGVQQQFLDAQGRSRRQETILVYDLGGGTFDVTLLEIDGEKYTARATAGDVFLGGIDWDQQLVDFAAERFVAEHGVDPRNDPAALQLLQQTAEDAKRTLSTREQVTLRFAWEGRRGQAELSRADFEELTGYLLDRTLLTIRQVLREADCNWENIDRLLLVGGSSRMPAVQQMLEKESGMDVDRCLSPDESIAHGAAIYAGLLLGTDATGIQGMSVTNVNSHHLGVLGLQRSTGRKRRQIMISRNSTLPAKSTYTFKTLKDDQTSVEVNVIEGGDDSGNDSTQIGRCVVKGLPPGLPAQTPVEVKFRYETNGRLAVTAWVPSVEIQAELTIERSDGLSAEEIQKWSSWIEAGCGTPVPDDSIVSEPDTPPVEAHQLPEADEAPSTPAPGDWKSRRTRVIAGDEEPSS